MERIEYPNLEALFRPKSIAIVGATEDPGRVAGLPLKYALDHGYAGKLFPVNRGRDTVRGLKCYPTVLDIPDEVDVAMVVVPSATVLEVVEQCAAKGVKAVVIGVSGFAEPRRRRAEDAGGDRRHSTEKRDEDMRTEHEWASQCA